MDKRGCRVTRPRRIAYLTTAMKTQTTTEDGILPLDDDTLERLDRFASSTGKTPAQAAALLLRDLLWDPDFWLSAAVGDGATQH